MQHSNLMQCKVDFQLNLYVVFLFQGQITLMDVPVFKAIQPEVSSSLVLFSNSFMKMFCWCMNFEIAKCKCVNKS